MSIPYFQAMQKVKILNPMMFYKVVWFLKELWGAVIAECWHTTTFPNNDQWARARKMEREEVATLFLCLQGLVNFSPLRSSLTLSGDSQYCSIIILYASTAVKENRDTNKRQLSPFPMYVCVCKIKERQTHCTKSVYAAESADFQPPSAPCNMLL